LADAVVEKPTVDHQVPILWPSISA
jgi:hypothetical protein